MTSAYPEEPKTYLLKGENQKFHLKINQKRI